MENLCPRDSVGLIWKNEKGQYLALERLKHPRGLAFVAGHLDFLDANKTQKEDFKVAALREGKEETGSTIIRLELILTATFPNPCGEYVGHKWQIFEVLEYKDEPRLMEPTKHGFVKWMSPTEIQYWLRIGGPDKPYDPAWFTYILPELAKKNNQDAKKILGDM